MGNPWRSPKRLGSPGTVALACFRFRNQCRPWGTAREITTATSQFSRSGSSAATAPVSLRESWQYCGSARIWQVSGTPFPCHLFRAAPALAILPPCRTAVAVLATGLHAMGRKGSARIA